MLPYDHGGDVYSNEGIFLDFSVNINLWVCRRRRRRLLWRILRLRALSDPHCRKLRAAISGPSRRGRKHGPMRHCAAELLFRFCACPRPRLALTLAPTFSEYSRAVNLFGGELKEHMLSEKNALL
jgi:threonine-phosphate decarboxylase